MRYRYNLQEPEPEPPPKDRSGSGSSQKHSFNQCCGQCCGSGRLLSGSVSGSGSDFEVRFRIWIRIFSEFSVIFHFSFVLFKIQIRIRGIQPDLDPKQEALVSITGKKYMYCIPLLNVVGNGLLPEREWRQHCNNTYQQVR